MEAGNETLDRIQREIQEALQREEELRQKYNQLNNNNNIEEKVNGFKTPSPEPPTPKTPPINGTDPFKNQRLFAPNSSKGVMQKFLKMRGKLNVVTMKPKQNSPASWNPEASFDPAKVTANSGKPIRNGFVSAEEKMKRELVEFQRREAELRLERRKSQPDLMAALAQEEEEEEGTLKPARSMVGLYSSQETLDDGGSNFSSLKPARSLADLCDASDEELETGRAYSLIRQFERMTSQ